MLLAIFIILMPKLWQGIEYLYNGVHVTSIADVVYTGVARPIQ